MKTNQNKYPKKTCGGAGGAKPPLAEGTVQDYIRWLFEQGRPDEANLWFGSQNWLKTPVNDAMARLQATQLALLP